MSNNWNLDALYLGFEDPNFKQDLASLKTTLEKLEAYSNDLANINLGLVLETYETLTSYLRKLNAYTALVLSVDTANVEANKQANILANLGSSASKPMAILNKYIAKHHYDLERYPELSHYEYYVSNITKQAKYLLSDDVEEVIAKFNISGGDGYENLQSYLTSTLEVEYNGEVVTLPQIRNLAYSSDAKVRKAAYEAELKAYSKIDKAVAFALNNIKAQVNTEVKLRNYDSALDMTLKQSKMSKATLDAMMNSIKASLPKFHEYLQVKANLLGYSNGLPWYELFAPIGSYNKTFTVDESKTILVDNFKTFSPDLASLVERAYDENWIDFYPKKGKVGGAFCYNLGFIKQSRILTNYDGSLSDVVTLAHELGHAYHGLHIENHAPLNRSYSMPVAETASTFNENIIMNSIIKTSTSEEKISLIESQLQDLTQIICDIYSRYTFETNVFAKREDSFMFENELSEMMLEAQKEAYGLGLDHSLLHPYMWVNKGHYYSSSLSFYNFPYAFGGLFARGLYAKYQANPDTFVENYQQLLHATTVEDVEAVASYCDIDLTTQAFWDDALAQVSDLIDEFITLVS